MNAIPETTVVLPSQPEATPGFAERLRPKGAQLLLGLGIGIAAEVLLDDTAYGLGHALFALFAGGAIAFHGGRESWQRAGEHRWVLGAAVLLVVSTMFHTAGWLATMSVCAALVLFALAMQGWTGERPLASLRTGHLFASPFKTSFQSLYAGGVVTAHGLEQAKISSTIGRYFPSALRLFVIVVPPVLILLLLLSSGDVVFRAKIDAVVQSLTSIELTGFIRGLSITLFIGLPAAGALVMTTRRRDGVQLTEPRRFLRAFEAFALLGSLTSLLLVFGISSTPCAMAPASCELPAGVTYADAAHEGFFQLLFAAIGILVLLMALPARAQLETARQKLTFTALSTTLVIATFPMVSSGIARLWRYETTYGLTVLRLLAYSGLFLVTAVLAWRALTLWTMKNAFIGGAMAMFTATMLGLAALSPDAFIARRNLDMANPDLGYLLRLSDEAMVPLSEYVETIDEPELRQQIRLELRGKYLEMSSSRGLEWNPARARAEKALAPF
ncbi:MAG: DUF4173 domain-containing protein [Archangium sp.]|nr:DUF4173 domain-containing protein [Archangium sp.]